MGTRKLDIVTARAVHLAMAATFDIDRAAKELVITADGNGAVLTAALLRVDRALTERWSVVADRAGESLRRAIEVTELADAVPHAA